ncbi:hypothetical protein CLCR_08411 [Cladophialophora carrionii]|uniref:Putative lipoate-protein ligase A n=1 Tax=Cladophialophora carrionii TaxID=86049 RepID=A0A1C1CUK3_9EURO|nr:hypothetical protein CLCR_08411 [Cladophialophora carrionii]
MRVAPRLLSTLAKWRTCSQSTFSIPLVSLAQRRAVHERAQPAPSASWNLEELWRVSKASGPLVFHLASDDPYLNLSIEHYLLTKSSPESHILLFYTNRPCVVIGRNQNPWLETDLKRIQEGLDPDEQEVSEARGRAAAGEQRWTPGRHLRDRPAGTVPVDLVRRRSGGGTVFHDAGNLNYSIIVPNTRSFTRSKHAEMVVQSLRTLNTPAHKWLSSESQRSDFPEVRVNERNDIVMQRPNEAEWLKVSGSAYKLTRGRALHHGTLLYSSPYIHRISDLLRSPGRDFITAHGVESVRSKVGNLAYTASRHMRNNIRKDITEAIVHQFWTMYGTGQLRKPGINEIILSAPASFEDLEEQNPWLAQGVQELVSPSWIFEQTPKFDFRSGMLDNHEVVLHADKGAIRSIGWKSPVPGSADNPDGLVWRQRRKDFGKTAAHHGARDSDENVKLYQVQDWQALLREATSSAERQTHEKPTECVKQGKDGSEQTSVSVSVSVSVSEGLSEGVSEDVGECVPDMLVQRLKAVFPLLYRTSKEE